MTTRFSLVFAILMMCLLTLAVGYKKLVMERAPITVEEPSTPEDPILSGRVVRYLQKGSWGPHY